MSFRIVSIECTVKRLPLGKKGNPWISELEHGVPAAWLRLTADDGTFGDAVAQFDPTVELIPAALQHPALGKRLLDQEFDSPAHAWRVLRTWPRGKDWQLATQTALAAVDVALWDMWGKMLGAPLYQLLGGMKQDIPVYASWGLGRTPVHELISCYEEQIEAGGMTMIKTAIGQLPVAEDLERVRAIREAVGDVAIAIDVEARWSVATARAATSSLREIAPFWVEEPTASWQGDCAIADDGQIPVATGENLLNVGDFRELLDRGFRGYVQPDPMRLGGVTPLRDVLALANAHGVPVAPHCYREIAIHTVAAAASGGIVEYLGLQDVVHDAAYFESPTPSAGALTLPEGPGLGFVVDPERFDRAAQTINAVRVTA